MQAENFNSWASGWKASKGLVFCLKLGNSPRWVKAISWNRKEKGTDKFVEERNNAQEADSLFGWGDRGREGIASRDREIDATIN